MSWPRRCAAGFPVVPVLVERAVMPAAARLPDELRAFARRNAFELRDSTWDEDVKRLVQAIGHRPDQPAVASGRTGPAPSGATRSRRLLFLIGCAVVIAAAAVLARGWVVRSPLASSTGGPPAAQDSPATSRTDAPQRSVPLVLPTTIRAALHGTGGDSVVYELRAARLEDAATAQSIMILSIRITNNTAYPINFWDESFRLVVGDGVLAPIGGLNEVIPARSSQDGVVVFRAPAERRSTVLRITAIGQTTEVALGDLAAGAGR